MSACCLCLLISIFNLQLFQATFQNGFINPLHALSHQNKNVLCFYLIYVADFLVSYLVRYQVCNSSLQYDLIIGCAALGGGNYH